MTSLAHTRQLIQELARSSKVIMWLLRHLDHYLKRHPLPGGLDPQRALTYMRSQHGPAWQRHLSAEVIEIHRRGQGTGDRGQACC